MSGNRLSDVLGAVDPDQGEPRPTSSRSAVETRTTALTRIATGAQTHSILERIDPARCRPWAGNGRHYERLTQADCQDLIDGLLAEQKQLIPAVVRRLQDDPKFDFEVIAGIRRMWSVAWLRANNFPDFMFVVEVKELTDEQAFRLQDQENRTRKDISDFERAKSYLQALHTHYGDNQTAMARRLEVRLSWLNRLIGLARLPDPLVAAYDDPRELTLNAAEMLAPLVANPAKAKALMGEAQALALTKPHGLKAQKVTQRLIAAAQTRAVKKRAEIILGPDKKPWIELKRGNRGVLDIRLRPREGASVEAALQKLADMLS
jgi:ParB family transcriptional regulator, chromosome partitioning protein